MSLLRVSSYGGGGVEQKFKPFANKLVSDWVSFNEDKVTILLLRLLRISAFVIVSLFFFFYSSSFIRSPFPFQSFATNGILPRVSYMMFSLCIGRFFEMVVGLYTANRLGAKKFSHGV